jgi:nucleotide-binding universal stress UspA family protein
MSGIGRVIVGASGSPGSLQALRYAEELARAHDATLIPALAWVPPGGDLADRRAPVPTFAVSGPRMPASGCGRHSVWPGARSLPTRRSGPSCSAARLAWSSSLPPAAPATYSLWEQAATAC